ncbi:hypothetical protein Trydic_g1695 [Trypoxylus dichotomus]
MNSFNSYYIYWIITSQDSGSTGFSLRNDNSMILCNGEPIEYTLSVGQDRSPTKLTKSCSDILRTSTANLIKLFFKTGRYPQHLKTVAITPTYNSGNDTNT